MNETKITPSTEAVRSRYQAFHDNIQTYDQRGTEFDRWLDAHDQDIRDAVKPPELTAREHLEAAWGAAYPVPERRTIPAGTLFIVRQESGQFVITTVATPSIPTACVRTLEPLPPLIPDGCEWVLAGHARLGDERCYWRRDRHDNLPWWTFDSDGNMFGANTADLIDPKPVPKEES